MTNAYRPDIDGLRALSIVAVILYHFQVPGFGGGYVGVDVFFVISGFLITGQLLERREWPLRKALADFYLRRARRILPAALVMLAVCSVLALCLLLPFDLKMFGAALAMGVAFLGNVAAWRAGDYFLLGEMRPPLVHMWSLAVEEQFYLAFPLLLLGSRRLTTRSVTALITGVLVVSFALCAWASVEHRSAAFFSTPTRAWELLAGALLALNAIPGWRNKAACEASALTGIVVLACVVAAGGRSPWSPIIYALPPVLATLLLIHSSSGSSTGTARVLSLGPVRFIGLISYSLYLWHLPLHVFSEYVLVGPLSGTQQIMLLALLVFVAMLSWRFVEEPLRHRRVWAPASTFLGVSAAWSLGLLIAGCAMWKLDGLPRRFDARVLELADTSRRFLPDGLRCWQIPMERVAAGDLCVLRAAGAPAAVLWGDSHALALFPAFESLAASSDWRLYAGTAGACRPLLGIESRLDSPGFGVRCAQFNEAMISGIQKLNPRLLIMAASWNYPPGAFTVRGEPQLSSMAARFDSTFERTLRRVSAPGRTVCVVSGVPRVDFAVPSALARMRLRGRDPLDLRITAAAAQAQYADMEGTLIRLEHEGRIVSVDPKTALCAGGFCRLMSEEGRVLYGDSNHLNIDGAMFVRDSLARCFDAAR